MAKIEAEDFCNEQDYLGQTFRTVKCAQGHEFRAMKVDVTDVCPLCDNKEEENNDEEQTSRSFIEHYRNLPA